MEQTHFFVMVLIATAISGCIQGDGTDDGPQLPPSPSESTTIRSGSWSLFSHSGPEGTDFDIDIDNEYAYHGPTVLTELEHQCAGAVLGSGEWLQLLLTGTYMFGGEFAGVRTEQGEAWTTTRSARVGASHGGAGFSGTIDGDGTDWFLAMHERQGMEIDSELRINPENSSIQKEAEGDFLCLVGPTAFDGGTFMATSTSLEMADGSWTHSFQDGIYIRLQVVAADAELSLTGPSASFAVPRDENSQDLFFCSREPGSWTLDVESFQSTGAWQLTAAILDLEWPGEECASEWRPVNGS